MPKSKAQIDFEKVAALELTKFSDAALVTLAKSVSAEVKRRERLLGQALEIVK